MLNLSPYKIIIILLTIFPMHTLHSCELFYNWKFLTPKIVHTEPPAIQQLQFRFSCPQHQCPQQFLARESLLQEPGTYFCIHLCLFSCGSSSLKCIHICLLDPRRVVDFSLYSTFYLSLGWSGDLQTPCMQNQKPGSISPTLYFQTHRLLELIMASKFWFTTGDFFPLP